MSSGAAAAALPDTFGMKAVRGAYLAFLLLIPVETIVFLKTGESGGITFSRLLGMVVFGLALVEWRTCFRKIPAAFWMLAWYVAAYALSQLWLPRGLDLRFRDQQKTMLQMILLFLISANLLRDPAFRVRLLRTYGWWVSLVAIGMMLGIFGGQFRDAEGRNSISEQDPNVAAGFFAMGAICLAGNSRILAPGWLLGRLGAALLAISALILGILNTGSRGGLLGFMTGIAGLAICGGKESRARRALIGGAVAAVLAGLVLREFALGTTAASRLSDAVNQGDTAGRTQIYEVAWGMVLEKPLLGHGGAQNYFTLGSRLNRDNDGVFFRDAHNLLLAILTEVGLVGAVPFVVAILYALAAAWRYGRRTGEAVPFALLCGQIAINTSLTGLHDKLFWIVLAAAAACGLEREAPAEAAGAKEAART